MATTVLVLGATGMLAKPVVRQLLADGFAVRAGVRDGSKAKRVLPPQCQFVHADVRDARSVATAMAGCAIVYLNLSEPNSPRAFDPDLEAARIVTAHAAESGVQRIMRISTMGIPQGASSWWVAQRKQEGDDLLRQSGVAHTIFHPTWFMESLPLFLMGRRIMLPQAPDAMLHWIAGADYARQVVSAMRSEQAVNRTFVVQGRYPVSMKHALIRFAAAYDPALKLLRVPGWLLGVAALAGGEASYLHGLLDFTFTHATGFQAQETFAALGEPSMTIEDFARSVRATGEWPKK